MTGKVEHKLKREYKGEGFTECITPTCSCGWRGIGYEAHNDWQYTLIKEQEDYHTRSMGVNNGSNTTTKQSNAASQ